MSKFLQIIFRDGTRFSRCDMEKISARILPENISPNPTEIMESDNSIRAVFNPVDTLLKHDKSICLGMIINRIDTWWKPGTPPPDGSYAIVRDEGEEVEIISDRVGSRPMWFSLDDDYFVISTSQRAIVSVLGNLEMNGQAVSWFISSGHLGPGNSWDRRISILEPNSGLILDRKRWKTRYRRGDVSFTQDVGGWKILLREARRAMRGMNPDLKKWIIPLSGGYDSRGILLLAKEIGSPKCMTVGTAGSLMDERSDSSVAKMLAEKIDVEFTFYELGGQAPETIINRMVRIGEGRIDHINLFTDGMYHYKDMYEKGFAGVVRGEEAFGWHPSSRSYGTDYDVRRYQGAYLFSDISNIDLCGMGLECPIWPAGLCQREAESFPDWRDRVYMQFRIPSVLSSVTDIIAGYMETASPLIFGNIIREVLKMRHSLRNDKKAWKKAVNSINPGIPFATRSATMDLGVLLREMEFVEFLRNDLSKGRSSIIPMDLKDMLLRKVVYRRATHKRDPVLSMLVESIVPKKIIRTIRRPPEKMSLDLHRVALRMVLVMRIEKLLLEDSKVLTGG